MIVRPNEIDNRKYVEWVDKQKFIPEGYDTYLEAYMALVEKKGTQIDLEDWVK